ncbi:MAG: MBL fold metallo-hydrolase [Proteobacteria bacterium]|nr:MBL fold metallo-hydrolase [Pseudomonadota bacterium]
METILSREPILEPNKWAAVPGSNSVEIYPLIRKPCVTCSNTFILKSDWYIIIIDPGAELEQAEYIRRMVLPIQKEKYRPVFIFFTHCHIDHFLAVPHLMQNEPGGEIICHFEAARAIETRDESITLANMNGSVLPECKVRAHFFENHSETHTTEENPLTIEDGIIELENGQTIPCQTFAVSENDKMVIFHTPGHSPDSVSYRLGALLCTGDLHLATTPGIAGKSGWDNEKLAVSLRAMIEKGKKEGISLVLPGHGSILSFAKAEKIFEDAYKDTLKLKNISHFDRERSLYLSEYATILLEEASNIFSIIAARLLKTSYYLEILEEEERAVEILGAIDFDEIDNIVNEFQSFFDELKGKRGAPLISKAVHFSRKVNKIFEPEKLSGLFDPHFLRRIRSLLSDFVNVVYGIHFKDQETLFDLNEAVSETLDSIMNILSQDERIFDSLDDDRKFVDELTRRIAYTPLFSSIQMAFDPMQEDLLITADKFMFQDVLTAFLEQLAISEVPQALLKTYRNHQDISLSVTPMHNNNPFTMRESKLLYQQHSMRLAGGDFRRIVSQGVEAYHYVFSLGSDLSIS